MFNFRKIYDYISSSGSEMYNFLQIGFFFADFEFRSLRRNLSRPKLPRFSTMFHICLLFNLFFETDSCIFPTSLSTDFFCLEISFQNFGLFPFSQTKLTEVFFEDIEIWFLSTLSTFLQNLRLCIFDQGDNRHNFFITKCLFNKLTANAQPMHINYCNGNPIG